MYNILNKQIGQKYFFFFTFFRTVLETESEDSECADRDICVDK